MNVDYVIAGRRWRFDTDYPLTDTPESALFRAREGWGTPDWTCRLREVETLPRPRGRLVFQRPERKLYLDGGRLWQEFLDRKDGQPIFCASCPAGGEGETELWALERQYPYTARMEQVWTAVDFPWQLLRKDILTLHSSCIQVDGQALLFLAPSGTGKSTQARLWHQLRGAEQLNGDKTGLECRDGTATAWGLPFCGTSGVCTDFQLPVRALVLLRQAKENSIRRLTGARAVKALLENCFGHTAVPQCVEKLLDLAPRILQDAPVYELACTPDERAVELLEQQMERGM